jgi:excisionase family DNA binding protein
MASTKTPSRAMLLSLGEAAELLGVSPRTVNRLVRVGTLTTVSIPGLRWPKLRRAELEALIEPADWSSGAAANTRPAVDAEGPAP